MIDTHTHLDDERFTNREEIIRRFEADGVELAINHSCSFKTMHAGLELARNHKRMFCTVGCHPEDAATYDTAFEAEMEKLHSEAKVLAVGEIGLDYYYGTDNKDVQKDVFVAQLELADRWNLPVNIHLRDAYGDMADILKARKHLLHRGGILHCYSGSAEFAEEMMKLGFYVAFGGAVTFKNAKKADVVKAVPLERVLTETDGPYLAPEPVRGTVNEPKNVRYVLKKLAEIYGIPTERLEEQVQNNVYTLFEKLRPFRTELELRK